MCKVLCATPSTINGLQSQKQRNGETRGFLELAIAYFFLSYRLIRPYFKGWEGTWGMTAEVVLWWTHRWKIIFQSINSLNKISFRTAIPQACNISSQEVKQTHGDQVWGQPIQHTKRGAGVVAVKKTRGRRERQAGRGNSSVYMQEQVLRLRKGSLTPI